MSYTPVTNIPEDDQTPFPTSGTTAERPPRPAVNQEFLDLTIMLPIWWTGTSWINGEGSTV